MTVKVNYSTWGYAITQAPMQNTAAVDMSSLTDGTTYDFSSVGTTIGTTRTTTLNAATAAGVGSLACLPFMLALLYLGRHAVAV